MTDVPFFSSSVVAKGPIVFWGSAKPQTLPQALVLIAQSTYRTNDSPSRATDVARRRRAILIYDWRRPELRTRAVFASDQVFFRVSRESGATLHMSVRDTQRVTGCTTIRHSLNWCVTTPKPKTNPGGVSKLVRLVDSLLADEFKSQFSKAPVGDSAAPQSGFRRAQLPTAMS